MRRSTFLPVATAVLGLLDAAGGRCAHAAADSPTPSTQPAVVFSAPRIHYDRQCLTIDGKDTFLFSGTFHYFRCPKPLWAEHFARLKAAGFNAVETYVAWDWHERTPPKDPDEFSQLQDMDDLRDWLQMATQQFGLYVLLRPGPYICAEWDGGGYPQWLAPTQKPAGYPTMWLRGNDPKYLAWCRHWIEAVAKVAAPFQITREPAGKAGIILWQLENEYNYDSAHTPEQKLQQLLALGHDARDFGIDVPLFTCQTTSPLYRNDPFLRANVLETLNAYPKYDMAGFARGLQGLIDYQPDKLHAMSELQGGWFSDVGGKLSWQQGFSAAQIQHITLLAWAYGFTSTNYYMGTGGTNFGDWAARGITTTYDYDAPVHEDAGVTARYAAVAGLGRFIGEHGQELARSSRVPIKLSGASGDVTAILRRTAQGNCYLFVFNNSQKQAAQGEITIDADNDGFQLHTTLRLDLPPFGSGVMRVAGSGASGEGAFASPWEPKPIALPPRPKALPAAIAVTDIRMKADPGPESWQPLPTGASEESVGIYDRRYVYYRGTLPAGALQRPAALVLTPDVHDSAVVLLDGQRLSPRGRQSHRTVYDLPADAGGHQLMLIYENPGRVNGGDELDAPGGFHSLAVVDPQSLPQPLVGWKMERLKSDAMAAAQSAASSVDVDDPTWESADIDGNADELQTPALAVYRCTFELTPQQLSNHLATLRIGRIDDHGSVYVNGQHVADSTDWRKPLVVDVASHLRAGKNVVSVVLQNESGSGGLGKGASLESTDAQPHAVADVHWEISGQNTGRVQHWESPELTDADWQAVKLSDPESAAAAADTLVWYRMRFASPAADPHVWTAWHLHLDGVGNGFLYLNGHPLGRWWQVGPQHDYFLPSCWLNTDGTPNLLAVCLRPTTDARITATVVQPDAETAEQR